MKFAQIVVVGAGNVASHLSGAFHQTNEYPLAFYNFKSENNLSMSRFYGGEIVKDLHHLPKNSLLIVAIPDDALPEFMSEIPDHLPVVHTSGSVPMFSARQYTGVFYPLQTFTKGVPVNMREVPFCIEANDPQLEEALVTLARSISDQVSLVSSQERAHLHLAAVVACNFSNHLYLLAEQYLKAHNLKIDMLLPLIKETAQKAQRLSPKAAQTGPAVRHDQHTINKHLKALESNESLRALYADFTQRIQKEHG